MSSESQVDEACEAEGIAEPLTFLASVMAGKDPRTVSDVWAKVQEIDEENFGDAPNDNQWGEIVSIIERDYEPAPVSLNESQRAANTLAEYRHSKRKSIELTGDGGTMEVPELVENEFDLFEAWFNDQF